MNNLSDNLSAIVADEARPAGPVVVDLANLDIRAAAEAGVEVRIKHITTGEDLATTIRVQGIDSRAYRDAVLDTRRARRTKLEAGGRDERTNDEIEEDANMVLSAITLGWDGVVLDGKTLEFSTPNALALYTRFPWIRMQLDEVVFNRGKFLGG